MDAARESRVTMPLPALKLKWEGLIKIVGRDSPELSDDREKLVQLLRRALTFYEQSVAHEQEGWRFVCRPRGFNPLTAFHDDAPEDDELEDLRFEHRASDRKFTERYRTASVQTPASGEIKLTAETAGHFEQLLDRMGRGTGTIGREPALQIMEQALIRYAVAKELALGLGVFSNEEHEIGMVDSSGEKYAEIRF